MSHTPFPDEGRPSTPAKFLSPSFRSTGSANNSPIQSPNPMILSPLSDPRPSSGAVRRDSGGSFAFTSANPPSPAPQYSHPYGYHSSASSLLTRTVSSPSQPINHTAYSPLPGLSPPPSASNRSSSHRGSRSMSSLKGSVSVDDLARRTGMNDPTSNLEDGKSTLKGNKVSPIKDKRKSMDGAMISARQRNLSARSIDELFGGPKGADTIKANPASGPWKGGRIGSERLEIGEKNETESSIDARSILRTLPANPKDWTCSELSTFIVHILVHGLHPLEAASYGTNATNRRQSGQRLPAAVVKDIEIWILRQGLNGRRFLKNGESGWAMATKQPPFQQVLLSISRNLGRISLNPGVVALNDLFGDPDNSQGAEVRLRHGGIREASVFLEQDEGTALLTDKECYGSAVRKLTKDFDHADQGLHNARNDSCRPRSSSISSVSSASSQSSVSERVAMFEAQKKPGPSKPQTSRYRQFSTSSSPMPLVGLGILSELGPSAELTGPVNGQPQWVMEAPTSEADNSTSSPTSTAPLETPYLSCTTPAMPFPTLIDGFKDMENSRESTPTPTPTKAKPSLAPGVTPVIEKQPNPTEPLNHMERHAKSGSRPYGALKRIPSLGSNGNGPRLPTNGLLKAVMNPSLNNGDTTKPLTASMLAELADSLAAEDNDPRDESRRVTIRAPPKVTETFPQATSTSPLLVDVMAAVEKHRAAQAELTCRVQQAENRICQLEEQLTNKEDPLPTLETIARDLRQLALNTVKQPISPLGWRVTGAMTTVAVVMLTQKFLRLANAGRSC